MTDTIDLKRAALQLLSDWRNAGLSHLPPASAPTVIETSETVEAGPVTEIVIDATVPSHPSTSANPPSHSEAENTTTLPQSLNSEQSLTTEEPVVPPAKSSANADPEQQLVKLAKKVAACMRCQELAETRTQTVFGVGNPQASVMFVGEAPGADEDATGEPFVGRAGKLLTKIIEACGWTREEIYICNILRCRPPGNRNPTTEEANNCREYLDGQIAIVKPDYIVCWGTIAAQNLLGKTDPIGKLREQFFEHKGAKVICTYHPSYLLRNPSAKKPVWEDMKMLLNEMGITPPAQ